MANNRIAVALLTVLCCLALLTGCRDVEKEKALEEASNLKAQLSEAETQLSEAETQLAQITGERDDLKTEVKTLKQTLEKLQAAVDKAITLEEKTARLVKERDQALDKVASADILFKQLRSQLAEQIQKASTLQEQNKKLQDTISKQPKTADETEAKMK